MTKTDAIVSHQKYPCHDMQRPNSTCNTMLTGQKNAAYDASKMQSVLPLLTASIIRLQWGLPFFLPQPSMWSPHVEQPVLLRLPDPEPSQ